jgi:cyclopropane fatty-acyl-phospholipid synthase-like methyltransferase
MELNAIYSSHPLRAETILGRLERAGADLKRLTELQLAVDPETGLTDQNHSGGVQSVLELALTAGVTESSRVVDIGCGLGGSARVLAAEFGCDVTGIESDAARCRDARRLTKLVHLDHLVSIRQADALAGDATLRDVDVIWGQDAWMHFPSPADFLARWVHALRREGRVAMADAFLIRRPATPDEETSIANLEDSWGAFLTTVDEWRCALEKHGCRVVHVRDVTAQATADFVTLSKVSALWPEGTVSAAERQGWEWALEACASGLVGSFRIVATRTAV